MPLIRASEDCDPENLVGVRFPMLDDSDRTKRVICLVTYAALHDRATLDGNSDDWMRAWLEHRGVIEAIASVHYDDGKFNENGEVVHRDRGLDANRMMGLGATPGRPPHEGKSCHPAKEGRASRTNHNAIGFWRHAGTGRVAK